MEKKSASSELIKDKKIYLNSISLPISSPIAMRAKPMTATACCDDISGLLSAAFSAFSFSAFFSASVVFSSAFGVDLAFFLSFLSVAASFSGSKCSLQKQEKISENSHLID